METRRIRFADVEINPRTREIRLGGEAVPVQRRVFDLLLYLIEHRDRAVGKDELQDRVWPGMIVTETALTRAVMKARRAVGDDSERQAVIRTVHGHGYRFIGEIRKEPADEPAAARVELPDESTRRPRLRTAWVVFVMVLLGSLVGVAALLSYRPGLPEGTRIAVLPFEDNTGDPELAWTGLGLMSYANRLFSEGTGADTVPARRMMEAGETVPANASPDALQELRRSLHASHLVYGALTREGGRLTLEYRVVHESGTPPPSSVSGNEPTGLVRELTRSVISSLPGSGLRRGFRTVSGDPFVNEAYARGLSLQLQGDVARARDYFEVAVAQDPSLFWPRYELALSMRDMGELEVAREHLQELVRSSGAGTDIEARAAATNALAQVYWRQREFGRAEETYREALDAARETGKPAMESVILVNLGILGRITGDLDGAREHLAAALRASEEAGDAHRGHIYQSLGQVEWSAGRLPLALDFYTRARDDFRSEGNQRGEAASLNSMARVDRRVGNYRRAEEHMLAALAIREQLGDFFGRSASLTSLAELYTDLERWDEALERGSGAVALADTGDPSTALPDALVARAHAALMAGRVEVARADLGRLERDFPDVAGNGRSRVLRARLLIADGDTGAARSILDDVLEEGSDLARIDALELLAESSEKIEAARAFWSHALEIAEDGQERGRKGRILAAVTRREIDEGHLEQAREPLRRLEAEFPDWRRVSELRDRIEAAAVGRN